MKHFIAALFIAVISTSFAAAQEVVFEVDRLNEGLPARSDEIDLTTPQSSVETFLEAAAEEDWATAAQVLNLNRIDRSEQAETGPRLAERLATILDRKVVISWQMLLERPDALDETVSSNDPLAGQPRKSLLLGLVELDNRNVAIRLNRLKPDGEEAVWVFSQQTVGNIDALYEQHGPTAWEKALPDILRREGPGGLLWWEFLGIPLMIAAAATAGWVAWRSFGMAAERTPVPFTAEILRGLRLPATLAVIAVVVHSVTDRFFVVSGLVGSILEPLIVLLTVAALMTLAVNLIDAVLDRLTPVNVSELTDPANTAERSWVTALSAVRRIAIVVAVVVTTGLVLAYARVFQLLGVSLLAAAGGFLFVLGFAAREVVGNILASLQIALNRSARIGDQLIYDGHLCTVERIHFTFVQLHVWDDTRLIVPVLKFVSDEFINRNIEYPGMTRVVHLKISGHTDLDALRERFLDYARGREEVDAEEANMLVVDQDEVGIDVRFAIPVENPIAGWGEEVALREAMIKELRKMEDEDGVDLIPHMALSGGKMAERQSRSMADVAEVAGDVGE